MWGNVYVTILRMYIITKSKSNFTQIAIERKKKRHRPREKLSPQAANGQSSAKADS